MADNKISPNEIMGKAIGANNEFAIAEQPDEALSQRFTGLVSGETKENVDDQNNNVKALASVQFSDLEKSANTVPKALSSGGAEQVDFDLISANEKHSLAEDIWNASESNSPGNGSALGEHIESLPSAGTLGDKILQGMQNIREHVENGARQVEANLDPARETMSMREMFETQWTMSKLMITEDYIGKIVSKGTQAFDTLLRNQ
ncbi:MAG: EscI/YscI/HrpB family type III secretion system inner rod protein [Endozoicomonas sp. (ex Botrylloides leachii)]|nr:EscI/YscI/HrpB family type III secretion system inner rod protein [Endozoicomonas sp. (ex Botrylloides leachii)]